MDINRRPKRAIEAHNRATNIVLPRFDVGDFVLVRQPDHRTMQKLWFRWVDPRRISDTMSLLVYTVESLDSGRREYHCARLCKYNAPFEGTTIPDQVLALADSTDVRYESLQRIVDHGEDDGDLWVRLEWDGFPDERNWTWYRLQDVYEHVPDNVTAYLKHCDHPLASQATKLLKTARDISYEQNLFE